jgi:RNA polymerase sigma-70 factor (sigma-E family)
MQQFSGVRRLGHKGDAPVDQDVGDFEAFVATRADALLRYGYLLAGNPHDAADLVQEALARLRSSWSRVKNKRDPEAFVRTTMTRLHIGLWRRRRREQLVAAVPEHGYTQETYEATEVRRGLWDALASLPRRQRAVLVLRYYECLTDEEIAAVLQISRGTVRSQAARALAKLRCHRSTGTESAAFARPKEESTHDNATRG